MTGPGGEAGTAPPVARCYRHPDREALIRCTRCERPICPACMRPASVGFHCPDDVRSDARTVRAPRSTIGARLVDSPPYVTVALIAANIVVYLATAFEQGGSLRAPTGSRLFQMWSLAPTYVHNQHEYYRLVTSAFLHVGLLHIGSNLLVLALIGPAFEQTLGRARYATVYLLAMLGGSATVYAFGNHVNATVGASGALFGLFGVGLVLARRIGLDFGTLVGTVVLNFVLTFSLSGISRLGHIGGFVTGLLAGLALGGLPSRPGRLPGKVQAGGLSGLFLATVALVGVGTAIW